MNSIYHFVLGNYVGQGRHLFTYSNLAGWVDIIV